MSVIACDKIVARHGSKVSIQGLDTDTITTTMTASGSITDEFIANITVEFKRNINGIMTIYIPTYTIITPATYLEFSVWFGPLDTKYLPTGDNIKPMWVPDSNGGYHALVYTFESVTVDELDYLLIKLRRQDQATGIISDIVEFGEYSYIVPSIVHTYQSL